MENTVEIKINKRMLVNILLLALVVVAILEAVELGFVASALKSGALCK